MTYDCRIEYFGKSEHNVWHWRVHLNLNQVTVFKLASMPRPTLAMNEAQLNKSTNNSKCDPTFNLEWQISVGNRKWWFIGLVWLKLKHDVYKHTFMLRYLL